MLASVVGPTLRSALAERETEKAGREARLSRGAPTWTSADLSSVPALMAAVERRVADLHKALDREETHDEAAAIVRRFIDTVTILPWEGDEPDAEVVGSPKILLAFAADAKSPRRGSSGRSSRL